MAGTSLGLLEPLGSLHLPRCCRCLPCRENSRMISSATRGMRPAGSSRALEPRLRTWPRGRAPPPVRRSEWARGAPPVPLLNITYFV
eukprot:scaffold11370_cov129-Isochrysis_galbana.AAC.4